MADSAFIPPALAEMPGYLESRAESLRPSAGWKPSPDRFSFLENVWHLADLEREGFGRRIRLLAEQDAPFLPNFDGDRIARERNYSALDLAEGLGNFRRAREENLARLAGCSAAAWQRTGTQEGVGIVSLADVPRLMAEHDRSHRAEIEELSAAAPR